MNIIKLVILTLGQLYQKQITVELSVHNVCVCVCVSRLNVYVSSGM